MLPGVFYTYEQFDLSPFSDASLKLVEKIGIKSN